MAENILYTYINNNFIGTLTKDLKGGMNFQYNKDSNKKLSLSFENKIGQSILTEVKKNCQRNLKKLNV